MGPPFSPAARPRLLERIRDARVVLIEAGSGYGKSTLIRQLTDTVGISSLEVTLGPREVGSAVLLERLRSAAIGRSSDVVAALETGPAAPASLVALLESRTEPLSLVIDDAHLLDGSAVALLSDLIAALGDRHRAVVAGRMLPSGIPLDGSTAGTVRLGADDLRLDADEVASVVHAHTGRQPDARTTQHLLSRTGGWAAAVAMLGRWEADALREIDAVAAASPGADGPLAVEDTGGADASQGGPAPVTDHPASLGALIHDALDRLEPPDRDVLGHLARLQVIPGGAATALGRHGLLERAATAGIPVSRRHDGTWVLPGPVIDALVVSVPLAPQPTRRLADLLADDDRIGDAVHLLLEAGAAADAGALLAGRPTEQVLRVDAAELRAMVAALPHDLVRGLPVLDLQLARACEPAGWFAERTAALDRCETDARRLGDAAVVRAVEAERARDLVRDGRPEEALGLATAVAESATADEPLTRARALDVEGRCIAAERTPERLRRAADVLDVAVRLYRNHRQGMWAAQAALVLAMEGQHGIGRTQDALRTIDEAIAPLPVRSRQRALMLTFRAQVLDDVGRPDEAAQDVEEAIALGAVLRDGRVTAYARWELARAEAYRGRHDAAVAALAMVEWEAGDWFDHATGITFLAMAAEVCASSGRTAMAERYLERARARPLTGTSAAIVDIATAAVRCRTGDPQEAVAAILRASGSGRVWPRDRWRLALYHAEALRRAGSDGSREATTAFEECARMGLPELPFVREGDIARSCSAVAKGAAGSSSGPGSGPGSVADAALTISVLGGLRVRRGDRPIDVPVGKPGEALRILVVHGGRVSADLLADLLWPDDDADLLTRLRNVLSRLRRAIGPSVERTGPNVVLRDAHVDLWSFESETRGALDRVAGDPERGALARTAAGRFLGELMPDEPDARWVIAPREHAHRRMRVCLDVLVGEATARGDLDEAARVLERILEHDPWDERAYRSAVGLAMDQGRTMAARALAARARNALAELGEPLPTDLADLLVDGPA